MNKPHKHAALIKQWADGTEIQVKSRSTGNWLDIHEDAHVLWIPHNEYRVKPVTRKYRVGLFDGIPLVAQDNKQAAAFEDSIGLIRWLTDWIEYEV
jgi:hypothetical protein